MSLLHSMPFLSGILMKIYQTLGANWERAGNVRFAVVYKPEAEADARQVRERGELLARRWSEAMGSTRSGSVRDFVSVGDVEIKVIGAECDIPDCQAPVRLILEQLIAQTGIPPFLLGLSWSTTERMSSQQADIMTSELTALRRTLTPVVERVCSLWLHLHGRDCPFQVVWEEINLQDQVEEARAALYHQQAQQLERQPAPRTETTGKGGRPWRQYASRPRPRLTRPKGSWRPSTPWGGTSLTAEEIYPFAVRLCDNQTDRDLEYFTRKDLEVLGELFVGKTGIFDHSWSAKDQRARIYRTEIVEEPGVVTEAGEPGCYLKGYAYMLRTEENEGLIAEIEGGIKKEVSVSCAVRRQVCSICGNDIHDRGLCSHGKGQVYGERRCIVRLAEPTDAFTLR